MIYRNIDEATSTYSAWYDSLQDVLDERPTADNDGIVSDTDFLKHRDKLGVSSKRALDTLVRDGWDEGVSIMNELSAELTAPRLRNVRRVRQRGDFGDAVDMQAVYGGSLDTAWERTQRAIRTSSTGNAITLAVQLSVAWSYDASYLHWSGAAVVKLADALVASGRNVQVLGVWNAKSIYITGDVKHCALAFTAKEFGEPIDQARLMTILGHPAFLRYYVFRAALAAPFQSNKMIGYPSQELPKMVTDHEPPGSVIYIPRPLSRDDAQRAITDAINTVTSSQVKEVV